MIRRTVARLTRRQRGQRALATVAKEPKLSRLHRLRRYDFEACICELECTEGSRVARTRLLDGTRGLYLVVRADGERAVIFCKHWPHARAGANELRCLREQMDALRATSGELITCGELSEELLASDTAPVLLVDGPALLARIERCAKTPR
jgi:hypothetical protein